MECKHLQVSLCMSRSRWYHADDGVTAIKLCRRGGPKRELIGGPHEKEHSDVAELNKRFSDMQQLWREPHVS